MYGMEVSKNVRVSGLERTKVFGMAAIAGFVATLTIAGLITVGEAIIVYPRGLFYTVIGNVFGASGDDAAMLGFYLHLVTGTLIGVVAASPIAAIKRLYIFMGHIVKRLLYGTIMGSIVWILFFVPISYTQVANVIENLGDGFLDVSGKMIRAEEISSKFSNIVVSALGFHIQYGLIYAVITGAFINRRMKVLKSNLMQ
jgi:hypothetical protein